MSSFNMDNNDANPLQLIFNKIDVDGSGKLDKYEIKQLFESIVTEIDNPENEMINDEELDIILNRIDCNGDGEIDFDEFVNAFNGIESISDLIDTSYLHLLFNKIDKDNSDTIDHTEIFSLFDDDTLTDSDKQKLLSIIDEDNDGTISFLEFKKTFRRLGCKSETDVVEKAYLKLIFDQIDENKDTTLNVKEWKQLFAEQNISLTEDEIFHLIKSIDENNDGVIDFYEFEKAFKRIKSIPDLVNKSRLHVIFNSIDTDHSNSLEFKEIKTLFLQEHVNVSDDNLHLLIDLIDKNNDGVIDFDEFEDAFDEIESIDELITKWTNLTSIDVGSDLSITGAIHSTEQLSFATLLPILAGGTAGICSRTVTAPLERVKILAQCGTTNQSMLKTWSQIIHNQGFFQGLWRGNMLNCLRVFPFGGLVTFSYGSITKLIPCSTDDNISYLYRFGAGVCAGGIATTLTYPLDLIRTQIQASMSSERVNLRNLAAITGFRNMFNGLWPTLFAMSLFVGTQNMSYDYLRLNATSRTGLGLKPSIELFIGCGMAAGLCAQTVIYPIDVIRRRIQANSETVTFQSNILHTTKAKHIIANRTWFALQNVVQKEGLKSIFAGLTPTYLKVVPSVAISVTVRDILLGRLNPKD